MRYARTKTSRLKEDLLAHQRSGLRLFMCHHLTWWHRDGEPWQITDLLDEQYGLDLVLLGASPPNR